MARYTDLDKLLDKRQEIEVDGLLFKHSWYTMYDNLIKAINEAPTADVEEVKHGKWRSEMRERCDWKGKKQQYYQPNSCSVCHEPVVERTPYCP